MASFKQIEANRRNARRSTGPRTDEGKERSRKNAMRHGLTAETVISSLEDAADYRQFEQALHAEYQPRSVISCELVSRLASVLWRLRRASSIETGLMQIQSELLWGGSGGPDQHRGPRLPQWYDELDVGSPCSPALAPQVRGGVSPCRSEASKRLARCFLQTTRLQFGVFETLSRYEATLWRQAAQIMIILSAKSSA